MMNAIVFITLLGSAAGLRRLDPDTKSQTGQRQIEQRQSKHQRQFANVTRAQTASCPSYYIADCTEVTLDHFEVGGFDEVYGCTNLYTKSSGALTKCKRVADSGCVVDTDSPCGESCGGNYGGIGSDSCGANKYILEPGTETFPDEDSLSDITLWAFHECTGTSMDNAVCAADPAGVSFHAVKRITPKSGPMGQRQKSSISKPVVHNVSMPRVMHKRTKGDCGPIYIADCTEVTLEHFEAAGFDELAGCTNLYTNSGGLKKCKKVTTGCVVDDSLLGGCSAYCAGTYAGEGEASCTGVDGEYIREEADSIPGNTGGLGEIDLFAFHECSGAGTMKTEICAAPER